MDVLTALLIATGYQRLCDEQSNLSVYETYRSLREHFTEEDLDDPHLHEVENQAFRTIFEASDEEIDAALCSYYEGYTELDDQIAS
jgi:arylsulfatase A-like enzyme